MKLARDWKFELKFFRITRKCRRHKIRWNFPKLSAPCGSAVSMLFTSWGRIYLCVNLLSNDAGVGCSHKFRLLKHGKQYFYFKILMKIHYRSLESGVLKIEKCIPQSTLLCVLLQPSRVVLLQHTGKQFYFENKKLLRQHVHISLFEKLRRKWQRENGIGRQQRALLKDSSGISQKDQWKRNFSFTIQQGRCWWCHASFQK